MYEQCMLDFEFNEFDYNSLSPLCKKYFQNSNNLTLIQNWDETSSKIATWLVLLFIPFVGFIVNKWVEYLKSDLNKESSEVPYEYKYVDEFEKLLDKKNKKLSKDEDKDDEDSGYDESDLSDEENELENEENIEKKEYFKLFIEEETPKGKIGLRYNPFTESFWWWSNTKDVPFKYLETVSRKYVIDYDSLDIYVDIRDELQRGIEKVNETKKKDEEEKHDNQQEKNIQRVYAKFRKYNQKASRILGGTSGAYPVLKERCNRYTYKGSMNDFYKARDAMLPDTEINVNLEKVLKEKEENTTQEKLSFIEWKKLNEKKSN